MNAISTHDLTKCYRETRAVDDMDLSIQKGELFALLGVNGAGKTTLIKMLSCLCAPSSGDAFLNGKSVVKEPQAVRALIAVAPQESAVAPNLTVRENLELMAGAHGFPRKKIQAKTAQLMTRFGLESVQDQRAKKLSGGWQRRLSIAMALVSEPEILFLDEPTLGLDVLARSELWQIIRSLKGKITILLTTHYMEEAESLCDRVAVMKNGRLAALGTVPEIMAQTGAQRFDEAFVQLVKEEETR